MTKGEILTKLIDISDFVEYAYSELYSTSESLSGIEGVDGVESAKSYASQADSYLFDAKQKIEELTEDISNATSV